ncbi:hypothetical protein PACTADRAFT_47713 [Pachysolen tannophilus NRRL Y-2460]|uniref:B30.2/SPRY domain-containing protein n=1 Tax=Pachysolen tannophilus NRRL Y-2460 TaxID=669874 RepID=A0A1E4U1K4_PACTA|nr:hypothetical protein PACTADRAFT_47713 [Pachysolen tannophilus NRRL Y-2460]
MSSSIFESTADTSTDPSETDSTGYLKIPSYLLETSYGAKLQKELLTSSSVLKSSLNYKQSYADKLATLGILGKIPKMFANDNEYTNDVINIFQDRAIASTSTSFGSNSSATNNSNSGEDGLNNILDRPRDKAIFEILNNQNDSDRSFTIKLPTLWNISGSSNFKYSKDNLLITPKDDLSARSTSSASSNKPATTWSNREVPTTCAIYYYEIKILEGLPVSDVTLGFLYEYFDKSLIHFPGEDSRSFGYSGKDAQKYCKSEGISEPFGSKFGCNDVIGCGINRYTNTIFYTRNGIFIGDAFTDIKPKPLYPCIGMGDFISVKTNFGFTEGENFMFDIDNYVKAFKINIFKNIDNSTCSKLQNESRKKITNIHSKNKNKLRDDDIPDVLNSFIISYFNHLGYADTAKTFKKDLDTESRMFMFDHDSTKEVKEDMDLDKIEEESDSTNRQTVRKYILDDRIDDLIEFLNLKYPKLLVENSEISFKLRSLKLINMISRATLSEKDNSSLIMEAIKFGKELQETYKYNPKNISYLNDISSLLAFENPLDSKFGYLLNPIEKLKILDELNKCILKQLGKSENSVLENLINQTNLVLDKLVDKGDEEAMLINVDKDYLEL